MWSWRQLLSSLRRNSAGAQRFRQRDEGTADTGGLTAGLNRAGLAGAWRLGGQAAPVHRLRMDLRRRRLGRARLRVVGLGLLAGLSPGLRWLGRRGFPPRALA